MELLAPEIDAHRARGLNPNHPHVQGTAQCEDIYFQAVENVNAYYQAVPGAVEEALQWIEKLSGRTYNLFDDVGSKTAVQGMFKSFWNTAKTRFWTGEGEIVPSMELEAFHF